MRLPVRHACLLAAATAAGLWANAEEPKSPPEGKVEAKVEPVCRVRIVDERGFELAGALLAFEDGVYHVRGPDGKVIELPEKDVRSVSFAPLEALTDLRGLRPKPPKPKPPAHPDRPGLAARPRPDGRRDDQAGRLVREIVVKSWERLRRLSELNMEGRLDEHIRKLSSDLRDAKSLKDAGRLLAELRIARNVKREPLTVEEWRTLVNSIADPVVRAQAVEIARRLFRPPGPPRRGPGEWKGPRRRPPGP